MLVKNLWRLLIVVAVMATLIINPAGAASLFTHGPNFSVSFNPGGGTQVGQDVNIHIKVDSANPGAAKINVSCGGVSKGETSEVEFDSTWHTNGCPEGNANINVCTKASDDPSWTDPNCNDFGYSLSSALQNNPPPPPPQPAQPSRGPSIQISFDPGGGAQVGQDVNIHIKVNSNNPGATKINVSCGNNSKGETSEVEFDSTWRTNGCSAGNVSVNICTKASDDPNWQNPNCNDYGYSLNPVQQNNPPPAERNPNDYFHNGDLIKTNSDGRVYVIIQEGSAIQRRWIPNPATLDALGMAQSNVDNKGFSERELLKLGKGSDVPDVNRDPDGFRTFKATFFPNLAPIVHDQNNQNVPDNQSIPDNFNVQEIPNGPQGLDSDGNCPASPAVLNVGGFAGIAGKDLNLRPRPNVDTDPLTIIPNFALVKVVDGPRCKQEVRWFMVEYKGVQGWAAEVGTGGEYHMYPASPAQNNQESVPATQTPQVEGYTEQVEPNPLSDVSTSCQDLAGGQWWNPFNPPNVGAAEQCTNFVNRSVEEIEACWGKNHYPSGGFYDDWARDPNKSGVCGWTVSPTAQDGSADFSNAQPGDIVTWNPAAENGNTSCAGANYDYGHVAVYQGTNSDGTIRVTESNWTRDHNKVPVDPECMNIIHLPSTGGQSETVQTQQQPTDNCSQYYWWNPIGWWCKLTNK